MISDEERLNIKKMLVRMEGDPEQVDMYLKTLSFSADPEEAMSYAWEVIRKVYEPDAVMQMEVLGVKPAETGDEDDGEEPFREDDGDEDGPPDEGPDVEPQDGDGQEDDENSGGEDAPDGDGDDSPRDGDDEDDKDDDGVSHEDKDKDKEETVPDEDDADEWDESQRVEPPPKPETVTPEEAPEPETLAGVKLPPTGKHTEPLAAEMKVPAIPETPLDGLQEGEVRETPEGKVLCIPSSVAGAMKAGPVYVLPADTGREAEIRVLELRAATNENLELARKIHAEIAQCVAEERQIRDSLFLVVGSYQKLAEQLVDNAQQAVDIRQKLLEGTSRAERFMNEDMSRMLQQKAQEATNDFYQESKDNYNELFKAAVRRYKQFTEAAMDFQDKMSDENARQVRAIVSKLGMLQKVSYATIAILFLLIGIIVALKILG